MSQVGDPAAMRSFAVGLRKDAEKIASRAAWLARRAGRMKFEGPAADDLRQEMLSCRLEAERIGAELREVANRLLSAAARAEAAAEPVRKTTA